MAKIFTYTIIMVGLLMLLNLCGITTASGGLVNFLINGGNLTGSAAYAAIVIILGLTTIGASILIGSLTKQSTESFIVAAFAGFLIAYTFIDMTSIVNTVASEEAWISNIVKLIVYPLAAGYAIAIIQWWRGNDI